MVFDPFSDPVRETGSPSEVSPEEELARILGKYRYAKYLGTTTQAQMETEVRAWAETFGQPVPRIFWYGFRPLLAPSVFVGEMDAQTFGIAMGTFPSADDLHRVNCDREGQTGHIACGWCNHCGVARFRCGHLVGVRP